MSAAPSVIQQVEEKAGRGFPHLAAARALSASTRAELTRMLSDQAPSDTSFVVFGSLARGEYTAGSDLDWTLLIDGQADEAHYGQVQAITALLKDKGYLQPGPTGVFGNLAFSHPILHQIGGQDDTNRNTTQRILLLLESAPIGKDDAHERVLRLILARYMDEDRGIRYGSNVQLIPRFLINDIVRYWRTVGVDFVNKQRDRPEGWAIRNAKLRMSRKLIFVSGLITCFSFELFGRTTRFTDDDNRISTPALVRFLRDRIRLTPLENLGEALLRPTVEPVTAGKIFGAYDEFLGILGDKTKREGLKSLPMDALGTDEVFREVSRIGRRFQEGLDRLFFHEDKDLTQLIQSYGVF